MPARNSVCRSSIEDRTTPRVFGRRRQNLKRPPHLRALTASTDAAIIEVLSPFRPKTPRLIMPVSALQTSAPRHTPHWPFILPIIAACACRTAPRRPRSWSLEGLNISYGIGLFSPENLVRLRYQFNRWLTLRTESGTQSGADLLYTKEHD